jgi:hypothetical protein
MNVISYSIRETVGGAFEDPVIRAGIQRLVNGTLGRTFEAAVLGPDNGRPVRGAFRRSVRSHNRAIRRTVGGNRYALDDGPVLVHAWVRDAHPIRGHIGHKARVGDARAVDCMIGHLAGNAPSVTDGVGYAAGIGHTAPIDNLVCSQAWNRQAPSIHDLVGDPTGGRRLGPRTVPRTGMSLAPALPQLQTSLSGGGRQLVFSEEAPASLQNAASVRLSTVVDLSHYIRTNARVAGWTGGRQARKQGGEQGDADAKDDDSFHTDFLPSPNKTPLGPRIRRVTTDLSHRASTLPPCPPPSSTVIHRWKTPDPRSPRPSQT